MFIPGHAGTNTLHVMANSLRHCLINNLDPLPILASRYARDLYDEVARLQKINAVFQHHSTSRCFNETELLPLGHGLELADECKKAKNYVFLHGVGLHEAMASDLISEVSHRRMGINPSRRVWRVPEKIGCWANASAFLASDAYRTTSKYQSKDFDHRNSLLSVDGNFYNNEAYESALYFFAPESTVPKGNFDNDLIDLFQLEGHSKVEFLQEISAFKSWIDGEGHLGRMNVIAIPNELLEDEQTCFVYRSKPFGHHVEQTHAQFLEVLSKDQAGDDSTEVKNQYRILIHNLDLYRNIRTFTFNSATPRLQQEYNARKQTIIEKYIPK